MQCVKCTHNVLFQILNKKNKSYNKFFVKFFHLVFPPPPQKNQICFKSFWRLPTTEIGKTFLFFLLQELQTIYLCTQIWHYLCTQIWYTPALFLDTRQRFSLIHVSNAKQYPWHSLIFLIFFFYLFLHSFFHP